ncbi:MAG: phosphoribosylanthranilate isomerase [Candidatus Saccharimonadaceae bacterium]
MNRSDLIIKVCGMLDGDNIRAVDALGVNWIGFIFYPHSKRYVGNQGNQLIKLPLTAERVGVFVNEDIDTIMESVMSCFLDIVQLHGKESPVICKELRQKGVQVMKAFGIGRQLPADEIARYKGCCDYFLFDTQTSAYGGSGKQFDWDILQYYNGNTPFILSGGIGPDDVHAIREFDHPWCAGIDINSKFELSPSIKNIESIEQFIKSLK